MVLILITPIIYLIFCSASIIVLAGNWKYYKKTYKKLPNMRWIKNHEQYYGDYNPTNEDYVVWFSDTDDFRLNRGVYLHNSFVVFFDPYSWYWLVKYKKWFKHNF